VVEFLADECEELLHFLKSWQKAVGSWQRKKPKGESRFAIFANG